MAVRKGEPVFSSVSGYADLENRTLITPQTNFRLASVSKQFTAAAILVLLQRSKLSLEDKLGKFFPEFSGYGENISIYQILTHSAGLPDYEDLAAASDAGQIHDEDVLKFLAAQQRGYFPPGGQYRYSNGGYCLLRLVVERVSGEPFADFMRKEIFIPSGMKNTVVNHQGVTHIEHRSYGYSCEAGGIRRTDQNRTSATIGDGGIYSSIEDMQAWDRALYTDTPLSQESRALMFKAHIPTDENPGVHYGLGFFIKKHRGETVLYHGGSSIGFRTGICRVPAKEISVIFLSNRSEGCGEDMCEKIMDIFIR